jgi:hypothetical protein
MDDGDGAFTMELQSRNISKILASGNKAQNCPQCGIIMNPVELMYSQYGLCPSCAETKRRNRVKGKMV